jgi:hypothetical protein
MTTMENEIVPAPKPAGDAKPAAKAKAAGRGRKPAVSAPANGAEAPPEVPAEPAPFVPAGAVRPEIPAEPVTATETSADTSDSVDDGAVDPAQDAEPAFIEIVVDEAVVGGEIVVSDPEDLDNGPDTIEQAEKTPDEPQPYRELGLQDDAYAKIRAILGRRPTRSELAMYSFMWS